MTDTAQDTGTQRYDLYEVRGNGKRGREWEGDTVDSLYYAWNKANPGQMTKEQFRDWAVEVNNLKTVTGEDCKGHRSRVPNVIVGTTIKLPEGNEIGGFDLVMKCPPPVKPVAEAPAAPPPPAPPAETPVAPTVPQWIPNTRGTVHEGRALDAVGYFLGDPSKDPAAEQIGRAGALRNGLRPGREEGTRVDVSEGRSVIRQFGEFIGFVNPTSNQVHLGRNDPRREQEYEVAAAHYLLDDSGEVIGPNPNNYQKVQSGARLVQDPSGAVRTVEDTYALISQYRRENPQFSGAFGIGFREVDTALTLQNNPLTNTGEGLMVVTGFLGIERAHKKLMTSFEAKPNAQDAEHLLQLGLQTAMHPLVWSQHAYGVPVENAAAIRRSMEEVVAKLPDDSPEKARLIAQYITPYADRLGDQTALRAAIAENKPPMYDYMGDWAKDRAQIPYIREGYGEDLPVPDALRANLRTADTARERRAARTAIREWRENQVPRYGNLYAGFITNESSKAPTTEEVRLGAGLRTNPAAQTEAALIQARVDVLKTLLDNPDARAAYFNYIRTIPGGMQPLIDTLHLTSNREFPANHQLLGDTTFKRPDGSDPLPMTPEHARRIPRSIAMRMAGETEADKLLHDSPNTLEEFVEGAVHFGTVGLHTPGKNRNMNNGLFGFQEEASRRWDDLTVNPETGRSRHQEVDGALVELLDRAIHAAERQNSGVAAPINQATATRLILSMDPHRAEEVGGGSLAAYQALTAKLSATQVATLRNQATVNTDLAGERNVTSALQQETLRSAQAGERVVTATPEQIAATLADGRVTLTDAQLAQVGGKRDGAVTLTTLPGNALDAARGAASPLAAVLAGTTAAGAAMNQAQMRALIIKQMAASPADMTAMIVSAMVAGNKPNATEAEKNAAKELAGVVENLSHVSGTGDDLSDLITAQVKAAQKPGGSLEAANAKIAAFFAGRNASDKAIAAEQLASAFGNTRAASEALLSHVSAALATLPKDMKARLEAIGTMPEGEAREAALKAFGKKFADQLNTLNAERGISLVELAKWGVLIYGYNKWNDKAHHGNDPQVPGGGVPGCCDAPTPGTPPPGSPVVVTPPAPTPPPPPPPTTGGGLPPAPPGKG